MTVIKGNRVVNSEDVPGSVEDRDTYCEGLGHAIPSEDKPSRPRCWRGLRYFDDDHAPPICRDAFGKLDLPAVFGFVDLDDEGSFGRGVVDGLPHQKEIRTELANDEGDFAEQELHLHAR